jgi:hypothetical protein
MQAGTAVTQSAVVWVPVKAYLFMPVQFAEEKYGFRWDSGDLTSVRVIARPSLTSGTCLGGNKESKVTLAGGLHIATSLAVSLLMSTILF